MPFNTYPKFLLVFIILIFIFSCKQSSPENTPRKYDRQGFDAYLIKDYTRFLDSQKKAEKLAPNNPKIIYNLARAYALKGKKEAAIKYLQKTVKSGFCINSKDNSDFKSIEDTEAFKNIQKHIKETKVPINNSTTAFTIPEKDLITEGITYDPVEKIFYLGSVHKRKVIRIAQDGTINDFATESQDGLWSITGMKVDAERRILWVNSGTTFAMKGLKPNDFGISGVFKYDLKNRKLIKKYLLNKRSTFHLFNDLVVNSKGDVFITDSLFGAVFIISADIDRLELFVKPIRFTYPNGITLSPDEKYLFVAHTEGTSVINIETKSCSILSHSEDITLCLIDGLYFHKNSLIAIQNDNWQRRVIRLFLTKTTHGFERTNFIDRTKRHLFDENESLFQVKKFKIIESGNPLFNVPTTGVLVGDMFYYIANSQINEFDHSRGVFPMEKLLDIFILKASL